MSRVMAPASPCVRKRPKGAKASNSGNRPKVGKSNWDVCLPKLSKTRTENRCAIRRAFPMWRRSNRPPSLGVAAHRGPQTRVGLGPVGGVLGGRGRLGLGTGARELPEGRFHPGLLSCRRALGVAGPSPLWRNQRTGPNPAGIMAPTACKTVIGQRLKQPGMFWGVPGTQSVLAIRCLRENRPFGLFWEQYRKPLPLLPTAA